MHLESYKDLYNQNISIDYTSKTYNAKYINTLLHAINWWDFNPVHINPITSSKYISILNGKLARHGISTVAQLEAEIFNVLQFTNPTEYISLWYENIKYKKPVNIWSKVQYKYSMKSAKKITTKQWEAVKVTRQIEAIEPSTNEQYLEWTRNILLKDAIQNPKYRSQLRKHILKALFVAWIIWSTISQKNNNQEYQLQHFDEELYNICETYIWTKNGYDFENNKNYFDQEIMSYEVIHLYENLYEAKYNTNK